MANFRWTWMYVSKKVDSADYPVGINLTSKINSKQKILSEQFVNRETLLKSRKLTKSQLMALTTTIFHIFKYQSWQEIDNSRLKEIQSNSWDVRPSSFDSNSNLSENQNVSHLSWIGLYIKWVFLSIWKASGHTKTFPIALFTPLT